MLLIIIRFSYNNQYYFLAVYQLLDVYFLHNIVLTAFFFVHNAVFLSKSHNMSLNVYKKLVLSFFNIITKLKA